MPKAICSSTAFAAKIVGQRLLGADVGQQPPVKIVAKLDEADRTQLGLDINDIVHGVVPIELSLQRGDRPEPAIKLHADLTNAEILSINSIGASHPAVTRPSMPISSVRKTAIRSCKTSR